MATKQKHRPKPGAMGPAGQARRLLDKGDFKQALKEAKVSYRQQPGPETRQILERAYLARGRQLHRAGLRMESRAVAEGLLELGVTDASVEQALPELLIAVGLFDRVATAGGGGPSLAEDEALSAVAADCAVLRPEGAPASLPAIRQGAALVRRALAALEAGDDAQATAALKDIPRGSPFADWKYLVRGLAAYYREDAAGMAANWERLVPGRFAARIATPLQALAGSARVVADGRGTAGALARLGNQVAGGPILDSLQRLQDLVMEGRWREAVNMLRVRGPAFRQMDPALPQQLATVLYAAMVRKGAPSALRDLAAVIEPLPIDPHWNRGLALVWEHCEDSEDSEDSEESEDENVGEAERYWRAYLDDLAHLECLLPAERTLAQALVWLRLGRMLAGEARPICPECGVCHEPDEAVQERAAACFRKSLELAPDLLPAYQALANAHKAWEEPDEAAATCRRLLERFPENLDALLFLANHYAKRDEPLAAGDFVFRAQRLKPLDPRIKTLVGDMHLASARHHALAGRWDEGRAELAAAENMAGPPALAHYLAVHRAVLELKAGQPDLAHRLLEEARTGLGEPAPVWLLATIEGTRYNLPETVLVGFEDRWAAARKKGRTSLAAGQMCRILNRYLEAGVVYLGRKAHLELLRDFLGRCSRIRWQAGDLRSTMEFLMLLLLDDKGPAEKSSRHADPGGTAKLLEKLAAKGRRKFPDVAFFQLLAGEMEMRKGPRRCKRRFARDCFQRALELAEKANDPDSAQAAKTAKNKLLSLDELDRRHSRGGPRLPLPPAGDEPPDRPEADEDDEGDEGFGPDMPPGSVFEMFARICREAGVDPEDILDELGRGVPFRFRADGGPKPAGKKRK